MTGVKVFLFCRYWQENWRFGKTKRLPRCRLVEEVDRQLPILGSHCTWGKWGHDRGYVEVSLQPHTRHPRGAQWSLPSVCLHGPLDEEERDKDWLQPRRKFGFLFYKKSLLLVSYFFISNLICSIKGLWKADRHQRWEDCKLLVGPVPHPYSGGILSLIAMAFFTLRLMVLFSSNRTFTLRGLMLWPVAWQCSKMAEYQGTGVLWSGDKERDLAVWPMNVIVRATPSSAEWRKPLPLNKKPLLNRYEGLDLPTIQYRPTCKKEPKRHFALKFDLLLISSWLFWHFVAKRARETRLIILVCRTSWNNYWLKNPERLGKSSKSIITIANEQHFVAKKFKKSILHRKWIFLFPVTYLVKKVKNHAMFFLKSGYFLGWTFW